jgi:hypothetical protein
MSTQIQNLVTDFQKKPYTNIVWDLNITEVWEAQKMSYAVEQVASSFS